jgi:hypothetical protein
METRSLVISEKKEKVLYKYTDNWQSLDVGYNKPLLFTFEIIKETSKSYIIQGFSWRNTRVPKEGKNIFAWDTEEKALFNYFKRKERQLKIFERKIKDIKNNLAWVKEELEKRKKYREENPTTILIKEKMDENNRTKL